MILSIEPRQNNVWLTGIGFFLTPMMGFLPHHERSFRFFFSQFYNGKNKSWHKYHPVKHQCSKISNVKRLCSDVFKIFWEKTINWKVPYLVVNFRGVMFYLTDEELQLQHVPSYIKVGRIKQPLFFEARAKGFFGKKSRCLRWNLDKGQGGWSG